MAHSPRSNHRQPLWKTACLLISAIYRKILTVRASYNGNTLASQASAVGSIPIARSNYPSKTVQISPAQFIAFQYNPAVFDGIYAGILAIQN